MLKMLIVEDEKWEREGLLTFLDWQALGIVEVDTAIDGIDGYDKALEMKPDILITDIKMPGMNGIEMSQKLRRHFPDMKIVILTGYDDFNLAKEAISLNSCAYVLKPVVEEELLEVIHKTVKQCTIESNKANELKLLKTRLDENLQVLKQKNLLDLLEGKLQFLCNLADVFNESTQALDSSKFAVLSLLLSYEDILKPHIKDLSAKAYFSVYSDKDSEELYLCVKIPENDVNLDKYLKNLLPEIFRQKNHVGVGESVLGLRNIHKSYVQAKSTMEFSLFWDENGPLFYQDISSQNECFNEKIAEILTRSNFYTKQLLHGVRATDSIRVKELITEMFTYFKSIKGTNRELISNYIYSMINETVLLLYNTGDKIDPIYTNDSNIGSQILKLNTLKEIEDYTTVFFENIIFYILDKKNNKDEYIIKKVLQLIDEKHAKEISLKTIAGEVFLSPNYLGNIFKKNVGKSFNEYLNEYRMEKAKNLLGSLKNKVARVAQEVGISNTSYFCMVFKNTFGMTPGEYQELVARK